jgi:hypothetical protein
MDAWARAAARFLSISTISAALSNATLVNAKKIRLHRK